MKPYYECHITFMGEIRHEALVRALKWKFSKIDGDPTLGAGIKCYATRQYSCRRPQQLIQNTMDAIAVKMRMQGAQVLRQKIEKVVFDQRFK